MPAWKCPKCGRAFARTNQRHRCGTGGLDQVFRNRPASLVELYRSLEAFARSLGPIEVVARERYILWRSARIFTDLVVMRDALRMAVHLNRTVSDPIFVKCVKDRRHVTHVAMLKTKRDAAKIKAYIKEAYEFSVRKHGRE